MQEFEDEELVFPIGGGKMLIEEINKLAKEAEQKMNPHYQAILEIENELRVKLKGFDVWFRCKTIENGTKLVSEINVRIV